MYNVNQRAFMVKILRLCVSNFHKMISILTDDSVIKVSVPLEEIDYLAYQLLDLFILYKFKNVIERLDFIF